MDVCTCVFQSTMCICIVCMCVCVATAVCEDGTSVSVHVSMTHLWAGSCLLCACVFYCIEEMFYMKYVYYSILYMYAVTSRLLL